MASDEFRIEHDTMGEVRVPATARWGAQTQRAVDNFPISGLRIERALIGALASIKGASSMVNRRARRAARGRAPRPSTTPPPRWRKGQWDDQFPVDVFQTGSGTSTNMNMNEVIANLATERLGRPVHPNDEVNASQSSNDVFPSAIHLAAVRETTVDLLPVARPPRRPSSATRRSATPRW